MSKVIVLTTALVVVGLVVCAIGSVFFVMFPSLVRSKIQKMFVLENGTEVWDRWAKPPVPVYTRFYIFNVTNPDEIMNGTEVPQLEQVGPFVFRQEIERLVEERNASSGDDKTLSVRTVKTYHFEPLLSLELDTPVNVISVPFISLVKKMLDEAFNSDLVMSFFLIWNGLVKPFDEAQLVSTMRAGELLFDGHFEQLLETFTNKTRRPTLPNYMFSLFGDKNGTDEGLHDIFTGKGDSKEYTMTYQWNGERNLTFWKGDYCNKIEGTDGRQFPPLVSKDERLKVFLPDLCRALHLEYEKDEEVEGIPAYKFVIPSDVLAAPAINPENECFLFRKDDRNISGILDVSRCRQGVPIVMSLPHFYMGSDELLQAVSGLKPDRDKHETSVVVEPLTGTVIKAARRLQVNVRIIRSSVIKPLKNVKDGTIFPVVWIDEGATIDEANASVLKGKVQKPIQLGTGLLIGVIVLGCLVTVISLAVGCVSARRKRNAGGNISNYARY